MLTRMRLMRGIALEKDRRVHLAMPDVWPVHLTVHPYTWEEVEFDNTALDHVVRIQGCDHTFADVPVIRTPLLVRGVVKARYRDGSDILLDLKAPTCEDLPVRARP